MPDKVQSPFQTKYIPGFPLPSDDRPFSSPFLQIQETFSGFTFLSDRPSISCCLVILQNPTQNHFFLEAFPEHSIPTTTESPVPLSKEQVPIAPQHLAQSLPILCLLSSSPSRPSAPQVEGPGFLHFVSPDNNGIQKGLSDQYIDSSP